MSRKTLPEQRNLGQGVKDRRINDGRVVAFRGAKDDTLPRRS